MKRNNNKEVTSGPVRKSARLRAQCANTAVVSLLSSDEELGSGIENVVFMCSPIMCSESPNQEGISIIKKEPEPILHEIIDNNAEMEDVPVAEHEERDKGENADQESAECTQPIPEDTNEGLNVPKELEGLTGIPPALHPPDFSLRSGKPYVRRSPSKAWNSKNEDSGSSDSDNPIDTQTNSGKNLGNPSDQSAAFSEHIIHLARKAPMFFLAPSVKSHPSCSKNIPLTLIVSKDIANSQTRPQDELDQSKAPTDHTVEKPENPKTSCPKTIPIMFEDCKNPAHTQSSAHENLGNSSDQFNISTEHIIEPSVSSEPSGSNSIPIVLKDGDNKADTWINIKPRTISVQNQPKRRRTSWPQPAEMRRVAPSKKGNQIRINESQPSSRPQRKVRKCGACRVPGHRNLLTSNLQIELRQELSKWGLIPKQSWPFKN